MLANPKIENIKIEKVKFEFDVEPFNKPEIKNNIISLLPNITHEIISFYVKNANTAIVNGLRRIIEGELKVKILTLEIQDIDTDEDFIKRGELIDRINYIPIDQDIPIDTEFSLNITNADPKKEFLVVHSSDLVQINGKIENRSRPLFAKTFRIAELRPGKYLIIPKIKIIEDYGYNNSSHCLTTQIEYHITDFIPVKFINDRANFVSKRVKVLDLINLFKKYKIKYDGSPDDLFRKTILIIPNKSYQHQLSSSQKEKIKKFDIIIENTESLEVEGINFDDKFLKEYHSTELKATNFFVSFKTNGNIDSKLMIRSACENIKERLNKLKEAIIEKEKQNNVDIVNRQIEGFITILKDNIKTILIIRGEDHTISQLLKLTIFELDPSIGLVNDPIEHPLNRTIMLSIKHPQPIKILLDAIDECVKHFNKIQEYFK